MLTENELRSRSAVGGKFEKSPSYPALEPVRRSKSLWICHAETASLLPPSANGASRPTGCPQSGGASTDSQETQIGQPEQRESEKVRICGELSGRNEERRWSSMRWS